MRSFAAEDRELKRYTALVDDASYTATWFGAGVGVFIAGVGLAFQGTALLVAYVGGQAINAGDMNTGQSTQYENSNVVLPNVIVPE
eukprot:SAG31_NODE_12429_length_943_cov_0.777251_1_plen_86_part_00